MTPFLSIALVSDTTSEVVRVILHHKERENLALWICIAALIAILVMGMKRK